MILKALKQLNSLPRLVVLPINLRSFSPSWDLHPAYQQEQVVQNLKKYIEARGFAAEAPFGIDQRLKQEDFWNTKVKYPLLDEIAHIEQFEWFVANKGKNEEESYRRYKHIFIYHYLYELSRDNRKMKLLKSCLDLVAGTECRIFAYVTPVNYQAGQKYVGKQFELGIKNNIKMLGDYIQTDRREVLFEDWSDLLDVDRFAHSNETTEHLNFAGRQALATEVVRHAFHILDDNI